MNLFGAKLFERSVVALGQGNTVKYTLFEHKRLFSILFYRWNTIDQIRFHTHAFASIAVTLRGGYEDRVMLRGGQVETRWVRKLFRPRFLPRNHCHAVGYSIPNTVTMVLAGPWQKTWFEYFADTDTWVQYAWGRVKIAAVPGIPAPLNLKSK